ncbi:hypothetical protein OG520_16815 [Streptomyces sp. NBC_00984]|uniref:hypothetical protein n=1 Tax=Streptomyces sp. NBC_00984 TaxID=2903700 RepID=UPI003870DC3F|nr:hypothetical protein OG520_16815 [Streptomyces sp. NBC_00984]
MGDFEFEMEPLTDEWASGYRGTVGPFGSVNVCSKISKPGEESTRQVVLEGSQFPDTLFSGGVGVMPSLDGGWLKVDGSLVGMDSKVTGIRKGSRWLELVHRERHYLYTSAGETREARLHREGSTVTLDRGRFVSHVGGFRMGKAEGDVDTTDLAIALVLEEVDRSALSITGALFAIPRNVLFGRQRDEGQAP